MTGIAKHVRYALVLELWFLCITCYKDKDYDSFPESRILLNNTQLKYTNS